MSTVMDPEVPVVTKEEQQRRGVLLRAAELLERDGWAQGWLRSNMEGSYCLVGAIAFASLGETDATYHMGLDATRLYDEAAHIAQASSGDLYAWNDGGYFHLPEVITPTAETVPQVLRKMATGIGFWEAVEDTTDNGEEKK